MDLQLIATILAIIVSSAILFKSMRTLAVKIWNKTLGKRGLQLDRIEAELRPNGTIKLRDIVESIAERQSDFEGLSSAQLSRQATAIFRTDKDGKCYYTNRAHQLMTGLTLPEMAGDGWVNLVAPSSRSLAQQLWREAVEDNREFSEHIEYLHPKGHEYMVHVRGYKEVDRLGITRGYLGTVKCIKSC